MDEFLILGVERGERVEVIAAPGLLIHPIHILQSGNVIYHQCGGQTKSGKSVRILGHIIEITHHCVRHDVVDRAPILVVAIRRDGDAGRLKWVIQAQSVAGFMHDGRGKVRAVD